MPDPVATPLCPALGVEVHGVDLALPIPATTAEWLRQQYRRHHLLLFRGRPVSPDAQAALARLFGRIVLRERTTAALERDDTQHVSNVRADGLFGASDLDFHVDQLFEDEPLKALVLYGIDVQSGGGDTLFSNGLLAYEVLPADLKARIAGLRCRHAYTYDGALADRWNMQRAGQDAPAAVHPMAWTDPDSGGRVVWANKAATIGIEGMADAEAQALIAAAREPLRDPRFVYRHRWQAHDLVLWNNRVLHHARSNIDPAVPRTLRRTPIL